MPLFEYEEIDQLTKEDLPVYKIPKNIQQTIDITVIAKNGVFCHTPKRRKRGEKASYSKAYRFEDVPFATLDEEEKEGKILSWCKFLNSMGTSFKWTLQNKNKDMQKFRETTLFDLKNDEFDIWRETYNELLDDRISKGKQGIELDMILTILHQTEDYKKAMEYYRILSNIRE